MNVLFDTNVILDVLLGRLQYADSRKVFNLIEQRVFTGYITASSITDIFYLVRKEIKNIDIVYQTMEDLAGIFSIAQVAESTITSALALHWKDFEDAVQYMTASERKFDCIITRNKSDYENAAIPCYSPAEFLEINP
jgi:predicted nucleic acid-binding protein